MALFIDLLTEVRFFQVLEVGDNVKEVKDSGFAGQKRTLSVVTLADNAGHAQVHPEGILMVLPGGQEKTEWKTPLGKQVVCSSANGRQIAVGLEGGTIVYFEMGPNGQMLNSGTYDVGSEITCVHHVSVFPYFLSFFQYCCPIQSAYGLIEIFSTFSTFLGNLF